MKASSITTVISALLSLAIAQPHNHHARHHHEKREIVWETTWEIVTETVDVTTTITVQPEAATTTPVETSATISPGVFVEPSASHVSASSSVFVAPTFSTPIAPVEVTSSTTPVEVAPTTSSSSIEVAPPAPSTTFSSVFVPPTTSSTPIVVAPTTTSLSLAPTTASSSSSTESQCAAGSPCTGDLTFYTTGEGACGWTNDGTTENVVALSYLLMGTESNDGTGGMNPFCGKMITINYGGKTTTAQVVDKCMGCDELSIDLSDKAFSDVADMSLGRVSGTWHFND